MRQRISRISRVLLVVLADLRDAAEGSSGTTGMKRLPTNSQRGTSDVELCPQTPFGVAIRPFRTPSPCEYAKLRAWFSETKVQSHSTARRWSRRGSNGKCRIHVGIADSLETGGVGISK